MSERTNHGAVPTRNAVQEPCCGTRTARGGSGTAPPPAELRAPLPAFAPPADLQTAEGLLWKYAIGMHEYAYETGKVLIHVKVKLLKHGQFLPWLTGHFPLSQRTSRYLMDYAKRCEEAGRLIEYQGKSADSADLPPDPPPIPEGKFRVVLADPPWQYDNSGFRQSAATHYATMTTDSVCDLPVADHTAPGSVVFLWVTSPFLPDGLRVLAAWGFTYKASFVWTKDRAPGVGWFCNTKHELLLLGTRPYEGREPHPVEKFDSVIEAKVSEHSRKPEKAYALIEAMYGPPRLELFARGAPRRGWSAWGNEVAG